MDEWKEWRRKQEEVEQERKRKQEEIEKRARILREQATLTKPTQPQKCPDDEEWSDELHQCVKKKVKTLGKPVTEQIPAQPVVPVGPITIEQKVAALNDKLAKFEHLLANLYGLVGQNYEEANKEAAQALVWKLGKK